MSAPKPLRDLPGFDEAMTSAQRYSSAGALAAFDEVGDVVLPGFKRVDWVLLKQLAIMIGTEKYEESRRIRLVPPPPPKRMSPRELGGWYARVLGPMAMIAKGVANDREAANG